MKEETFIIYLYREKQRPHRCYVGEKLYRNNKQRDYAHRSGTSHAPKFNSFVKKHILKAGKIFDDVLEYFELETYHGTVEGCSGREHRCIDLWNSIKNGWNLEKNSVGGSRSEETRRKISESLKGRTSWNKGIPCSEEKKRKLSEANKGNIVSKETRIKISKSTKGLKKQTEATRIKISKSQRGNQNGKRKAYLKAVKQTEEMI